jgi:hypothetical protein
MPSPAQPDELGTCHLTLARRLVWNQPSSPQQHTWHYHHDDHGGFPHGIALGPDRCACPLRTAHQGPYPLAVPGPARCLTKSVRCFSQALAMDRLHHRQAHPSPRRTALDAAFGLRPPPGVSSVPRGSGLPVSLLAAWSSTYEITGPS